MNTHFLKIPVEMAVFALREARTAQVCSYAASHFIYSGKARLSDRPDKEIASLTGVSSRTVYRHFSELLEWNWMGKDEKNGWVFFRGIDRIRQIEDWHYKRSGILYGGDLKTFKPFLAAAVLTSLAKTKKQEQRTEFQRGNSLPTAVPISAKAFAKTLKISVRSAQNLRKLAAEHNYIKSQANLIQIENLSPDDLKHLKNQDMDRVPVTLSERPGRLQVPINRIRFFDEKLFLQGPNLIEPMIKVKSR